MVNTFIYQWAMTLLVVVCLARMELLAVMVVRMVTVVGIGQHHPSPNNSPVSCALPRLVIGAGVVGK